MDSSPSPPPPPGIAPAVVKESRVLLTITGGILCLLGLVTLCGGGFVAVLAGILPDTVLSAIRADASLGGDPEALEALQVFETVWDRLEPFRASFIVMIAVSSLAGAAAYAWLGIGTIQGRRWARKLLVAIGWAWVGYMALQLVGFLASLPMMFSAVRTFTPTGSVPGGWSGMIPGLVFQLVFNLIQYAMMAAPGVALIIVGNLRNVRLACEQLDPVPRWTDRVPAEVLPLWVVLVALAFQGLVTLPLIGPVVATFPDTGWNAFGLTGGGVVSVAFLGLCAWLVARMNPFGWWLTLGGTILGLGFVILFFQGLDFPALMQAFLDWMPVPEEARAEMEEELSPEMLERVGEWMRGTWVIIAVTGIPFLAYLAWIKEHFNPPEPAA